MTDSRELYTGMEGGNDLSSAMGTETLADREHLRASTMPLEPEQNACQSRFSTIVDT